MAKKPAERPDYDTIIAQLDDIAHRLEQQDDGGWGRAPSAQPAPTDGSGGRTAPTPFVSGERSGSEGTTAAATHWEPASGSRHSGGRCAAK
jgi:hypothetical protein